MRAIMLMFDSLKKNHFSVYENEGADLPNFEKLAERACKFENFYAGSLPCMPARRELHTGRHNFLHRAWGPLEPFDISMPEILKKNGVHSHLVSDHFHYWLDGGANYHPRYSTWENIRGQEGDPWQGRIKDSTNIHTLEEYHKRGTAPLFRQDRINREFIKNEQSMPQTKVLDAGLDFIEQNEDEQNWFLQIECFDPHEPFFVADDTGRRAKLSKEEDIDWPQSARVEEEPWLVEHIQKKYKALLEKCDKSLGRVLQIMDEKDMWKDTMLIVNTDHGYMLGEKGWWGKNIMPFYNEIVNLPFFLHIPGVTKAGSQCNSLAQTIDICPTILKQFAIEIPPEVQGIPLQDILAGEKKREFAIFGIHGGHVNITDGRYVYMRAPINNDNKPLYEYTLMPARSFSRIKTETLQNAQLHEGFSFTKGCPVLQIDASLDIHPHLNMFRFGDLLFDLENDPHQEAPIQNESVQKRLLKAMQTIMQQNDAPKEQYERLGLNRS